MALKTLHLTYLYNEQSGGVATVDRSLLQRATETGRQMVLVIPGDRWAVEQVSETVKIYRVEASRSLVGDRRYRVLLPHHFLFPSDTRFKQILRDERPDVVEACDKYSLFYLLGFYRMGWIDGTRGPATVALTMERMDDNFGSYISRSKAAMAFCRWYMHDIYFRIPKYHIAISRYVSEELKGAPTARQIDKIRILSLGVDSNTFRPATHPEMARRVLREALGLAESATVLLYAGRLSREKNIPLLMDSFRKLRVEMGADCHLALIGGGMMRDDLEKEARKGLQGRLHLMPHVQSRSVLATMLAGADVFVHPNEREPFGIGPLEAMACGVPVVLPNEGGVMEYAHEGNSWPVAPRPEAFAAAIQDALRRGPSRTAKTDEARKTAVRHDWSAVTERYFAQYETFHEMFQASPEPWVIPYRPRWWPEWRSRGWQPRQRQGDLDPSDSTPVP